MQTLERSAQFTSLEPESTHTWLQVLSHVSPEFGGIAVSVPPFARATEVRNALRCPIVGFCPDSEMELLADKRMNVGLFPGGRMRWLLDPSLRSRLKSEICQANGVHIHGLWETHSVISGLLSRSCKRPYMISAHGMLEPWALRHKRVKKALYATLIETRILQRAACLRALTPDEADDYRNIGLSNPIVVIPSGVDVPEEASAEDFFSERPELRDKRIVLFLGRLHQKKGLPLLLRAWSRVARPDDAHLVIAGPDSENMLSQLERARAEFKLEPSVTFAGMLSGSKKWSALAAANLFVLPSYSEGFSIAIIEAMAMALPVLVTRQCHFPEVAKRKCGWVVEPESEPLEESLREFFELPPSEASRMGERGRELVCQKYRWPVVGRQMAEVYNWLEGGPKPNQVTIV